MADINAWIYSVNPLWWVVAVNWIGLAFLERKIEVVVSQNRQLYNMLLMVDGVGDNYISEWHADKDHIARIKRERH